MQAGRRRRSARSTCLGLATTSSYVARSPGLEPATGATLNLTEQFRHWFFYRRDSPKRREQAPGRTLTRSTLKQRVMRYAGSTMRFFVLALWTLCVSAVAIAATQELSAVVAKRYVFGNSLEGELDSLLLIGHTTVPEVHTNSLQYFESTHSVGKDDSEGPHLSSSSSLERC